MENHKAQNNQYNTDGEEKSWKVTLTQNLL
jgi:hypothetical protein